jgi:N-acetylmuramoyl-L-alanine amidase
MKLAIVVGHTNADKGASSVTLGQPEYTWNSHLATLIEAVNTNHEIKTFFRDNGGIPGAYAAADNWGSNAAIELHYNSADSMSATGTGILYFAGSTRGRRLASLLFEEIDAVLGLGEWPSGTGGVVTPFQASGQQMRGNRSLSAGQAPAALIEPFFGSNPSDSATAQANKSALAGAIVKAAERFFA